MRGGHGSWVLWLLTGIYPAVRCVYVKLAIPQSAVAYLLGVIARAVKRKRLIILGLAALVAACIVSIIPNFRHRAEWKRMVAALQSLPHDRLDTAVQSFKRDRKPTDSTVPLRELVAGGYLRAEDIRGLEDRDVTVSLSADETSPQMVLIRVRASDGSDIVALADGSIQKVARR